MAWNERKVTIVLGADDALLLQGVLRNEWGTYRENEVVTPMLRRVEEALDLAQRPTELDKIEKVLG